MQSISTGMCVGKRLELKKKKTVLFFVFQKSTSINGFIISTWYYYRPRLRNVLSHLEIFLFAITADPVLRYDLTCVFVHKTIL